MQAVTRDASWHRNPSSRGRDLLSHIAREDIHRGEAARRMAVVAAHGCAPARDVTLDAQVVPPEQRFRRPGIPVAGQVG